MKFLIVQKLFSIIISIVGRDRIVRFYRKLLRVYRKFKCAELFKIPNIVYKILIDYFINVSNKEHFGNLRKTMNLDYYRILSYIYFFDSPSHIKNTEKKSVLYFYWFKRSLKWLFWFIILAFYPLIHFKYIIWSFVYKHFIKYFFRILDIIVCDIIEDFLKISWFYKPIKKVIKFVLLDFIFYILPVVLSKLLSKMFSWRSWLYGITYIIFGAIDYIYYKILRIILRKVFYLVSSFLRELKYWRYWTRKIINFPNRIKNKFERKILNFSKKIKIWFIKISNLLYYRYIFIILYKLKIILFIYKIKEIYIIFLFFILEPRKCYNFLCSIEHTYFFRIYIILLKSDLKYIYMSFLKYVFYILISIKYIIILIYKSFFVYGMYTINIYNSIFYDSNWFFTSNLNKFRNKLYYSKSKSKNDYIYLYQDALWFEFQLRNHSIQKNSRNN